jgi:fluoride exporter
MFRSFLLVGMGGAVGSMARYGIGYIASKYLSNPFPVATFVINILGSFIIGILFALSARNHWLQQGGMLLLASGFCGGFTTFSTFALDNVTLVQKGFSVTAILYTGLSLTVGLLLCRLGIWLTE